MVLVNTVLLIYFLYCRERNIFNRSVLSKNMSSLRDRAQEILNLADIQINGDRPWDIQVHNEAFYARVLTGGSLALGESYMDEWWDAQDLSEFFNKLLTAKIDKKIKPWKLLGIAIKAKLTNSQRKSKAFEIGLAHYDKGNDLYETMLDKRMVYTCAYWNKSNTLDDAQEAKLDLVCKKIGLKKGDRVLDIGCGWGSFAEFAAKKYGAHVVGITVSKEQLDLGRVRCAGLPVELRLQDYRDVDEKFDHIVSLGMIEHVGYKNYKDYMKVAHRCLDDNGLFLLHTIGGSTSVVHTDRWIGKYIFPNSMLPSLKQLTKASEGLFVWEDVHNFGSDYDTTLLAWFANFDHGWPELQEKYGDRFYRMWKYYLLCCAGTFRSRKNQLWQIVLSKNGVSGGYTPVR
jgi:cyclopropane-fatty-acyl-phospholipid synthase